MENETADNCSKFYTPHQKREILLTTGSTGLFSIGMCTLAVTLLFCFQLHKKFAYRLAAYQVVASMFISIVLILATVPIIDKDEPLYVMCIVAGFFLEYFLWVKLLIALCLIFHIFCLAVFLKNFKNLEAFYIVLSLCFPMSFTWIPFVKRSYGLTESWCWIRDTECNARPFWTGFIEQYALWFGPLATCIAISFIAIVIIVIAFKYRYDRLHVINTATMTSSSEEDPLIQTATKKYVLRMYFRKLMPLLIYPVVFFTLFLLPVIRRWNHSLSSPINVRLTLVHSVCYSSFGLVSSILLIFHILLVRRLKTWDEHFASLNNSTA